jgi:hypothetical protein
MKHRFKNTCYDAAKLLDGCNKLSTFMKRLIVQSDSDPDMWDPMTYRGDGFEALVEVLVKYSPIDKRINIRDYSPWDSNVDGRDVGVDGLGKNHSGAPHTVQIKFRSNVTKDLTANQDQISNFVAKTLSMYPNTEVSMTIFTTASDLMESINQDMYHGKVRTLGYRDIGKLIDNNTAFWDAFRAEMGV